MSTLISTRRIILAAALALSLPAHAVDWNEMLRGVLGQPSASGVEALSNADINAGLKEALTHGRTPQSPSWGGRPAFSAIRR